MRYAIKNIAKLVLTAVVLSNTATAQIIPNSTVTAPVATQVLTKPTAYSSGIYVNYVRTYEAKAPIQVPTDFEVFDNTKMSQATQYLDGLGRPIQTVVKQGSVNNRDIVSYNVYDEFGREAVKYLPYEELATLSTINNTGDFKLNPFNSQQLFNEAQYNGEQVFYSKTIFEASPLSRPLQSMAAGNSWAGNNRGVSISYEINDDANEVRIWDINAVTQKPTTTLAYDAGELYRTITTDEHGKKVVEYKDKEGKVILKKVQISDNPLIAAHTGWLCTYYIYDDFGLLRWVLQPKLVEYLNGHSWTFPTGTTGQTMLDELAFRYTYDERNRMIVKKVPGAGEVYMVYDQRDRLVLTQDAKMRINNQWLATKYDALNRPIQTYLWNSLKTHEAQIDAATNIVDYPGTGTLSSAILLTETYYDNYNWDPSSVGLNAYDPSLLQSSSYYTNTTAAPLYAIPLSNTQNTNTLGLVTGTKVRVLGGTSGNDYIYTVSYYDDKNRVIQSQATQYGGGTISTTSQYDFSGKVLVSIAHHTRPSKSDMDITSVMTYDAGGRLVKLQKDINGQGLKTITQNTYNALGQLKGKELGIDMTTVKPVEAQDYTYNIRGWLTGINRGLANPLYTLENTNQSERWFGMQLCYDYGFDNGGSSNAMYNGNISGQMWVSKTSGKQRAYGYTYDAANRLMKADFNSNVAAGGATPVWNKTDGYDFSVTMGDGITPTSAYDANGNIKAMKQMGYTNGSSTAIDILNYSYYTNTNKLQNVIDNGMHDQPVGLSVNNQNEMLGDFRYSKTYGNKPDGDLDYQYDENGNLIFDDHKDIESIEYNHLNLPQIINVTNKGRIIYTYDATGNKLQKKVEDNTQNPAIVTTTNYVNGFVYEEKNPPATGVPAGEVLQFINHEEGRFRPSSAIVTVPGAAPPVQWVADFFIKDHLGNVRMNLTEETTVTDHMLATLEYPHLNDESLYFDRLVPAVKPPGFDDDPNNTNVNNLEGISGSTSMGMGILVKVNAGDRIKTGVFAHYSDAEIPGTPPTNKEMTNQLIMGINAGFANMMGQKGLELIAQSTPANLVGITNFLNRQSNESPNGDGVLANLNWMMLDGENLQLVTESSGYQQVPGQEVELGKILVQAEEGEDIVAQKSGYLYIFVNNKGGIPVQFDDLFVIRKKSAFLEETHYYPFGLSMNGISSKANSTLKNKVGFGGKELQCGEFSDGTELAQYDFGARFYNQQLGRWHNCDPLADKYTDYSPYCYVANNPLVYIDPNGKEIVPGKNWAGSKWETTFNNLKTNSKTFKQIIKPFMGKKVDYILNYTNIVGGEVAFARTTLARVDKPVGTNGTFGDNDKLKEGAWKSTFQPMKEVNTVDGKQYEINDLGRALMMIHEGIHANKLQNGTLNSASEPTNESKQHSEMASSGRQTIIDALTEYNTATGGRLSKDQINQVSYLGLLGTDEGKAFVTDYAKTNWGVTVTADNLNDMSIKVQGEIIKLISNEKK